MRTHKSLTASTSFVEIRCFSSTTSWTLPSSLPHWMTHEETQPSRILPLVRIIQQGTRLSISDLLALGEEAELVPLVRNGCKGSLRGLPCRSAYQTEEGIVGRFHLSEPEFNQSIATSSVVRCDNSHIFTPFLSPRYSQQTARLPAVGRQAIADDLRLVLEPSGFAPESPQLENQLDVFVRQLSWHGSPPYLSCIRTGGIEGRSRTGRFPPVCPLNSAGRT